MSDANSETVVDVDVSTTDDLTAFEAEFYGTADPTDEVEEQEGVTDVETDADADPEPETEEEGDEPEAEEEAEQEEPAKKPNRKTAKERISELTAKNREDRAFFESQIAELKASLEKLEKNPEPKEQAPAASDEPRLELPDPDAKDANGELVYPLGQFDPKYNAEVVRRTLRFEREQAAAEAEEKAVEEAKTAAEKAAEEAQAELFTEWSGKLEATEKDIPDLREKIVDLEDSFKDLEPTHGLFLSEAIMKLARGPEVLYYLSDNIGEAEAIVAMSPLAAAIALGEIQGRLPVKPSEDSNKKRVSTAPNPPIATRGTSASKRVAPDTDNLEDFEREFFNPQKV